MKKEDAFLDTLLFTDYSYEVSIQIINLKQIIYFKTNYYELSFKKHYDGRIGFFDRETNPKPVE
jgi:hypothetical protein